MTMTFRTDETDDRALETLASVWGVSKQQAISRAVRTQAEQIGYMQDVVAATRAVKEQWAGTLNRLKDL